MKHFLRSFSLITKLLLIVLMVAGVEQTADARRSKRSTSTSASSSSKKSSKSKKSYKSSAKEESRSSRRERRRRERAERQKTEQYGRQRNSRTRARRTTTVQRWSYENGSNYDPESYILIDKPTNNLKVIKGNRVIFETQVCLGARYGDKTMVGDHKTPEGTFSIASIENSSGWSPSRNQYGGAYGPWFFRLKAPQSSHIGIHGTNRPYSIGQRQSEGCIRLHNSELVKLRELVGQGMKVIITKDVYTDATAPRGPRPTAPAPAAKPAAPAVDYAKLCNRITDSIQSYVDSVQAASPGTRIGVCAIIDKSHYVEVNATDSFPMYGLGKFPLALAVAQRMSEKGVALHNSTHISSGMLQKTTRKVLEKIDKHFYIPMSDLLGFIARDDYMDIADALTHDVVLGTDSLNAFVHKRGYIDTHFTKKMTAAYKDTKQAYANRTTPLGMAEMMRDFFGLNMDDYDKAIVSAMASTPIGPNRIVKGLEGTRADISHMAGTGPVDKKTKRITAVNDAAYIRIPGKKPYTLVILIANSGLDQDATEAVIAHISRLLSAML